MNQPIAKELAKIEALTSVREVKDKRGAQDRALTLYEKTAQDWNLLPLDKLSTQETSKILYCQERYRIVPCPPDKV